MVFEHVSAEGKSLVTDPETAKEPGRYVEGLLRMKDKYGGIVDAAFDGDRQFINALHLSFENFVNLNNRSAEYLSLYVDDQLRRSLKGAEEEEVEVEEARTPWSTEAMTEEAREKLLGYGVAPPLPLPMAGEDPPCPRCGSREVVLKNPFGATLCKTLYQCAACGEVFEAFKTV